jgi:proton-dependent oligopeptide transporter, POT family
VSSPRTQEYVSRIAPADRVGVYMGFSFLPIAFGNLIGGFLYGRLYSGMSDIYTFILMELQKTGYTNAEALATRDKSEIYAEGMAHMQMTSVEMQQYLFITYEPFKIWWVYGAVGLATVILFLGYNRYIKVQDRKNSD